MKPSALWNMCRLRIVIWLLVGTGIWSGAGCASVGVTGDVPVPGVAPFDHALMAYVRGELGEAEQRLHEALRADPGDLRARDLLCAIHREDAPGERCREGGGLPDVPSPLAPEALLREVLHRNPEIRQAVLGVVAARAQLREAQVNFGPELMILTRFHPAGIFARLIQSMLSGLLEREALMDQAEARVLQALGTYAQIRGEVLARATMAYLDRREAEAGLEYATDAAIVGAELQRVAETLYRYGVVSHADSHEIHADVLRLHHAVLRLRGQVTIATAELASLLGTPDAPPTTLTAKSVAVEPSAGFEKLIDAMSDRHSRLVTARARVDGAQARQRALLWSLPHVDLRGTYGSSTEEGRGDFLEGLSIGLRVRTPLLIWPLQRARNDREAAFLGMLERELEQVRNALWLSTVTAVQALKDAEHRHRAAAQEARARRMAWKAMEAQDRLGVSRHSLDVLRARLAWLEAEHRLVEARFALQRAQVRIHAAMDALPRDLVFVAEPTDSRSQGEYDAFVPFAAGKRALWVWRPTFLGNRKESQFFLDFLQARHIGAVFLFASRAQIRDDPDAFRSFLRLAHHQGVEVHALNGEPTWILPGHETKVIEFFDLIARFNRAGQEEERFDAVHVDVEITKRQLRKHPEILAQFVQFVDVAYREAARHGMRLVFDIPTWFDEVRMESGTLLDRIVRPGSEFALMAYQKDLSRALQSVREERTSIARAGGTAWMGISADRVHLRPTGPQPPGVDFEERLASLAQQIGHDPVFNGLAIHDYDRYRRILLLTSLIAIDGKTGDG